MFINGCYRLVGGCFPSTNRNFCFSFYCVNLSSSRREGVDGRIFCCLKYGFSLHSPTLGGEAEDGELEWMREACQWGTL